MKVCEKCGYQRSSVPTISCGACLMLARGETPRPPTPLTPEEKKITDAFFGAINGTIRGKRRQP